MNLIGATDLPLLAGVLVACRAVVSNDSGAMHFAAALGVRVTAVFGPTDERVTGPRGQVRLKAEPLPLMPSTPVGSGFPSRRSGRQPDRNAIAHAVLTHDVWCRPCMLRECPIDHRCMRIGVDAVLAEARRPVDAIRRGSGQARAVFLDRDGTLIEEVGYLAHRARRPVSVEHRRGPPAQSRGTARRDGHEPVRRGPRILQRSVVEEVHHHIADLLEAGGAHIDAYYYCPHHPDGKVREYTQACDCRKPGRGLVDRAVRELGVDPSASFVVGDRWLDVALARAVGGRGVLVRTGYGATEESRPPEGLRADAIADNLIGAVSWILGNKAESAIRNPRSAMLIARSVHPLPGESERKERFLALVDGFSSRRVW